jgi:hypothetical protein
LRGNLIGNYCREFLYNAFSVELFCERVSVHRQCHLPKQQLPVFHVKALEMSLSTPALQQCLFMNHIHDCISETFYAGHCDDWHSQQLSPAAAAAWRKNAWGVPATTAAAPGAVRIQKQSLQYLHRCYAAAAVTASVAAAAESEERRLAAEAAGSTNAAAWA